MPTVDDLFSALAPILPLVRHLDPDDPTVERVLNAELPLHHPDMQHLRAVLRAAVASGAVCDREANGVSFSRVAKAADPRTEPMSIDAVHMSGPGPGHTHPHGEIDLCFAVEGEPRFDGAAPGWKVYPSDSWHVPTVSGGTMDILYFLPGGAIVFGPKG